MTTILPLTWGPQIQRPLRPGGCPMIRTWQRKGSMSCLKHLQVKHFRNLLIPNALFLKCPKRLFIFYKEKFFFFFFCQRVSVGLSLRLLTWWERATLSPGYGGHPHLPARGVLRPCRRGRSSLAQWAPRLLESHVNQT